MDKSRESEVEELAKFLEGLPIRKFDLSFLGDRNAIADFVIHEGYRKHPPVDREDIVKELELLKSYFEDRMQVVLHRNDIKWSVIDKFITYLNGEGK